MSRASGPDDLILSSLRDADLTRAHTDKIIHGVSSTATRKTVARERSNGYRTPDGVSRRGERN